MYPSELYKELSKKYPTSLSCVWDNDGMMVTTGDICEVERVLVALDCTDEVLRYAAENGFDTIVTHHPMIFSKLNSVTPDTVSGRKVIFAIMNNITVMSFHTRLDAAEGGVNDALAECLGLENIEVFGDEECPTMGRIGTLNKEYTVDEFASYLKDKTSSDRVEYSADIDVTVKKVAVLGGAGKDFLAFAKKAGADCLVTGEASYNFMLDVFDDNFAIFCAGHYFTEDPVCKVLQKSIEEICGAYTEYYPSNYIKNL